MSRKVVFMVLFILLIHCNTLLIHVNGNGSSIVKREALASACIPTLLDIYEDVRDLCMFMLV